MMARLEIQFQISIIHSNYLWVGHFFRNLKTDAQAYSASYRDEYLDKLAINLLESMPSPPPPGSRYQSLLINEQVDIVNYIQVDIMIINFTSKVSFHVYFVFTPFVIWAKVAVRSSGQRRTMPAVAQD